MARKNHNWSKEDRTFLIENFQELTCEELAARLSLSISQVKNKCRRLSLKKTKESLSKIYSVTNQGHYQKGNNPRNMKYDNYISERVNYKGQLVKWIRISSGKWIQLHKHLWKEAGNIVPEGHVLRFKDKNPSNCCLENLEVGTRATNQSELFVAKKKKVNERAVRSVVLKKPLITAHVEPKRTAKVFDIKPIDFSALISVKIDRRTTIYVKPGTDVDAIREKYGRKII